MKTKCKHRFVPALIAVSILLVLTGNSVGSHRKIVKTYFSEPKKLRSHREARLSGTSKSHARQNLLPTKEKTTVILRPPNNTELMGQTGTTVTLKCVLGDTDNTTVMWLKRQYANDTDFTIVTIGNETYVGDARFQATSDPSYKDWTLDIRYAQEADAGVYECKVPTHPPTSIFMTLKLIESIAEIIGLKYRRVKPGAPLRLTCILHHSKEKPTYIFWYHWDRMINYDLEDGANVRTGRSESELIFPRAEARHAGNYSCVPDNARPDHVYVYIALHGDISAIQQATPSCPRIGFIWNVAAGIVIHLLSLQYYR